MPSTKQTVGCAVDVRDKNLNKDFLHVIHTLEYHQRLKHENFELGENLNFMYSILKQIAGWKSEQMLRIWNFDILMYQFELDLLAPFSFVMDDFRCFSLVLCCQQSFHDFQQFLFHGKVQLEAREWSGSSQIKRAHRKVLFRSECWIKNIFHIIHSLDSEELKSLRFYASHKFRNQLLTKTECIFTLKIQVKSCFVKNF